MLIRNSPSGASPLQRWVIAWLLVALPVLGVSASLTAMLGSLHAHASEPAAADPMAGWQDFRRSAAVHTPVPHAHAHGLFERHHHAQDDTTVVTLDHAPADPAGAGDTGTGLASLSAALAPPAADRTLLAPVVQHAWDAPADASFASRTLAPLLRPPRA